jgi:hypothetical protein
MSFSPAKSRLPVFILRALLKLNMPLSSSLECLGDKNYMNNTEEAS